MELGAEDREQDIVDPLLRAHIRQLCSALGGSHASNTGQYILGDEALACLKDLKRWLKGYDEKLSRLDVARCIAECRLVTGDLLEIIASWTERDLEDKAKAKIVLACVELLVPLTWPFDKNPNKMTVNHHKHIGVLEYAQVAYKNGLLHHRSGAVLRAIVRVCLPSMALPPKERTERDEGIIKLVLYLLRNIALIDHPNPTETDNGEEISRDITIITLHEQNIFDLLLTVSSGMGGEFRYQGTVVMEILYHILKGVDIGRLFVTDEHESAKNMSQLETLLCMERNLKAKSERAQTTRHSRFGTTLWVQKSDGRRVTVSGQDVLSEKSRGLEKINDSKRWKKPKPRGGKSATGVVNDFDVTVTLRSSTQRILRGFVENFLHDGFNPLFSHIRKAIERESEQILQDSHPRQFLYLTSWFLGAERMRRKAMSAKYSGDSGHSFGLVAVVLNQETLILLKNRMRESFEAKHWIDVEAGMRCLLQLLLTVQDMALSSLDEDQEIAENMQGRIFYEEDTLDLVLSLLRNFKAQPFGYLDACTELAHVHLRMLERYSKQNTYIFIKAKHQKSQRRKAVSSNKEVVDTLPESDEELEAENRRNIRERAFNFIRYETKFLSNNCVDAFLKLLTYYNELEYIQIKRALTFLYRVFVKREMEAVLFRIDVLDLLNRMIQGKDALPYSHPAYKEVAQFTNYYIKHLVRKLQKTPALYVELLFSKTNRSNHFIQYGHDTENTIRTPRQPPELYVSPKLSFGEQVGVAVSVLLNENKDGFVDWLKVVVARAVDERQAWESEFTARQMEKVTLEVDQETLSGNPKDNRTAMSIVVTADTTERKMMMSKDPKVILLLKLLGLKGSSLDESFTIEWEIPPNLSAADLRERLRLLKSHTDEPPVYEEGRSAEDFLRRKSRSRPDQLQSSDEDDDENSDTEAFGPNVLKVPNPQKDKKKLGRRRRESSGGDEGDEEAARLKAEEAERRLEARRKKDEEKRKSIKSEVYIQDSDDEENEERDQVFFAKEKELRLKMGTIGGVTEAAGNTKKRKIRKDSKDGRRKRIRGASNGNDTDAAENSNSNSEQEESLFLTTGSGEHDSDENMRDIGSEAANSRRKKRKDNKDGKRKRIREASNGNDTDAAESANSNSEQEESLFVTTGSGEHDSDENMPDIGSDNGDSTNADILSARDTSPPTRPGPSPALGASTELIPPRAAKDTEGGYNTEGHSQHHVTNKTPSSLEDKEGLGPHSPTRSVVEDNLDDSPPKPSATTNRNRRRQVIMVSDDEE